MTLYEFDKEFNEYIDSIIDGDEYTLEKTLLEFKNVMTTIKNQNFFNFKLDCFVEDILGMIRSFDKEILDESSMNTLTHVIERNKDTMESTADYVIALFDVLTVIKTGEYRKIKEDELLETLDNADKCG